MPILLPKKTKYRKPHRIHHDKVAFKGNTVAFGEYGLISTTSAWISNRAIEAARIALTRQMKRGGKSWIRIFPHMARTKKPLEVRMGKGKGSPEEWVAVVKINTVMFEVAGVEREVALEALRLAMHKLPVKCKIVHNPNFDYRKMGDLKNTIYEKLIVENNEEKTSEKTETGGEVNEN